jgi:hypothetical protein
LENFAASSIVVQGIDEVLTIQRITYRPLASMLLLLLLLLPTAVKDIHYWWEEHDHAVCEAEAGDRHLHNEEYAFHDCALCLFFYPQHLKTEHLTPIPRFSYLPSTPIYPWGVLFPLPHDDHVCKRGPPWYLSYLVAPQALVA